MNGLDGRIVVVTGATGLLGSAITRRLASEGATVVVCSRDASKAESWIAEQGEAARRRLVPMAFDLADEDAIREAFGRIVERVGPPTALVANASHREGLPVPEGELSHRHFSRLLDVDVAGHFVCARCLGEALPPGRGAGIVLLSSIYALAGADPALYPAGMEPTPLHYAVTKAATIEMARYLAGVWGDRGIRVNAVVPGGIRSPERQPPEFVANYSRKTMLRRMARPDEIAGAVTFLVSEDASYITGACLAVDGGFLAW